MYTDIISKILKKKKTKTKNKNYTLDDQNISRNTLYYNIEPT